MEKSAEAVKRDFSDIVLPGGLQDHVRALAAVTANTRSHGAPFRHMLFYGPPGPLFAACPPLSHTMFCTLFLLQVINWCQICAHVRLSASATLVGMCFGGLLVIRIIFACCSKELLRFESVPCVPASI